MEKVKITNEYFELLERNQPVMKKIMEKPFSPKLAYWIVRVFDKIDSEHKSYAKVKRGLLLKYVQLDEKGEPKSDDKGNVVWDAKKGGFAAYIKDLQEILDDSITLDVGYVYADLDGERDRGITLSPLEARLLPFIKDVSEKKDERHLRAVEEVPKK